MPHGGARRHAFVECRAKAADAGTGDHRIRRTHSGKCDGLSPGNRWLCWLENTFRRFAAAVQSFVIGEMRRAIGADRVIVLAHVDENMRMIERRQSADAHEFLGADPHLRNARLVVKMRRAVRGHDVSRVAEKGEENARNINE
jgi:hypothetical protein